MAIGEHYYHGGLPRFELSPKPAYLKFKELTQDRWHSEAEVTTDANGCADFRGFYGDYEVAIRTETKTVSLLKNQNNVHKLTV